MKEEGISWDDVAKQLRTKRHQMATTAADLLPESLTDKEKAISRLLNFTIWVLYIGTIFLAVMASDAVLESVAKRDVLPDPTRAYPRDMARKSVKRPDKGR